jgi:hypothetical protein
MKNRTANRSKERGGGGLVSRSRFVEGFRFVTRFRFVYGSGFVTGSRFVKGFGSVTLWIRFVTFYSYFSDCGKLGTVLLQTAKFASNFSAISQCRGMMDLHLGDGFDLWQFAVNTRRRALATRSLIVRTWAVRMHCTPICLRDNLNWKPNCSKILQIRKPTFTSMVALLYGS